MTALEFARSSTVALVEDDADFRESLVERMGLEGLEVRAFGSPEAALKVIGPDFPGVVVTDLRMPGMDGRQLLGRLQTLDPALPVILITGHGDVADAVAAMRAGAYDFVAKPFPFERLMDSLGRALEKRALVLDNRRLATLAADQATELPLMGTSPAIVQLRATLAQLADARMDVLIQGETGVGKEAVARTLHNAGRRRLHAFVTVNCGALPQGLVESEMFGHELGAFAGAVRRRAGHVERAHNGSLFLDQIDSMPLDVQVKMLRVVEEREILPIGASEPRVLDLRILASSRIDLAEAVGRGAFRQDLFYRLNVMTLSVPPLRERREDMPLLFARLVERAGGERGAVITDAVRRRLTEHDWPGNIRELAHYAQRLVLNLEDEGETSGASGSGSGSRVGDAGLADRVARFEGEVLRDALAACRGDIAAVLEQLRLPRKTLYDKLTRHGLRPADFRQIGPGET